MKSIKTLAIVLRRMDLGEADRLIGLFTIDRGKVKAVNRGARKLHSKLAGHLEPFTLVDCQLQEGRTFYTVSGASSIQTYSNIRNDLQKTSVACYFLELVDALTVEEQSSSAVFKLLQDSLAWLDLPKSDWEREFLVSLFTWRLLIELGFRPELFSCIACNEPIKPSKNYFSCRLGGILGPECQDEDQSAIRLSTDTIKVMRIIDDGQLAIISRLKILPAVQKELSEIVENYLNYQAGRSMRSADFMAMIKGDSVKIDRAEN